MHERLENSSNKNSSRKILSDDNYSEPIVPLSNPDN